MGAMESAMERDVESEGSAAERPARPESPNWLKIAVLSAGSALAGGLAAAWWYRKTLTKLRETGEISQNSHFGTTAGQNTDSSEEDI